MTTLIALMLAGLSGLVPGQPVPGTMDVRWHEGAVDCGRAAWDPLQVHAYDPITFILRQNPCAHFEANFIYLLIGRDRALLIDTGAVADPGRMPLAETVFDLLGGDDGTRVPLLVAHTHGHADHRAGDGQFDSLPLVRVMSTVEEMRELLAGGDGWPDGIGRIDLGGRIVHVLPAPGHHPGHLVFHDERTALLFTGDLLLPGRLLVDDLAAYRESVARIIDFVDDRPVAHVLGGHLELDAAGEPYPRRATHRPDQGALELAKEDLLALADALDGFNGFYARHPRFIISNPVNNLLALCAVGVAALALIAWGVRRLFRRRRGRGLRGRARAAGRPVGVAGDG